LRRAGRPQLGGGIARCLPERGECVLLLLIVRLRYLFDT
jgi:hypothetical protein